jgi:hypothetical protein
MKTKPYQQHLLGAAFAALSITTTAFAANVSQTDPQTGGIGYRWTVTMGETDFATMTRHVGAWSWEDNSLFGGPGQGTEPVGWTHTSDWVALTLTDATTFTLRLESQAGVPWPGASPLEGRLASTASMFPSFTIWNGWDNDVMPQGIADTYATPTSPVGTVRDDHHTYDNDGPVVWAEDLGSVVGFVNNSTATFSEATYTLPAGQYSIVLGSNAPATDTDRQGYRATFTSVPEPSTAATLLAGLGTLALRRRRAV